MPDWLRVEYAIEKPSREGRKKGEGRMPGPIEPACVLAAEALSLERTLRDLVNQAYTLIPAGSGPTWKTAPPRMPNPPPAT